jgi:uncharacterized heparinase superfamily protein
MQAYESTAIPELNAVQTPWAQVILAWIRNQTGAELFGMPGYRLTLKGSIPEGFITAPHDVRPVNTQLGKAILSGRFTLAGARMSVQGSGDPWNRPSPSRAFAVELHRFNWLPALMSQGDDGAKEAGRLFSLWHKTFCRWTPFSWSEEILPRRLINIAIFAKRLIQVSPQYTNEVAQCLSEQGRHLSRLNNNPAWQGDKAVALIILGCVLSGKPGYTFLKQGQKLLPKALKRLVLNDGSHVSRSPQQGLNLLYDLLLIEDAMNQRGLATPETLDTHVDQLSRFIRALSHPDGSLCAFQGAESLLPDEVLPALVRNDVRPAATETPAQLEEGRYHRLSGRSLIVIADAGDPRPDAYGYAACDHPMAFEVSGGRDKLMVLPGWSPKQNDRQGFRIIPAGNTLTMADSGILTPITGQFGELLNFGLQGPRYKVRSRRVEAEDAGSLLEMEHDGWKARFGLRHERRLYIDTQRDELRGEDRLTPQDNTKQDVPMAAPFTIHFLLHPEVQASMARDKKSVLLRGPGGRGWWLRHDAKDVAIEDSHVFEHDILRKTLLISLRGVGRLDAPTRVRWKLSPAEA